MAKSKLSEVSQMMLNPAVPLNKAVVLVAHLAMQRGESKDLAAELEQLIRFARKGASCEVAEDLAARAGALLKEIEAGPLVVGTLRRVEKPDSLGLQHGRVRLGEGREVRCLLPDEALARELQPGDTVGVDAQGNVVACRLEDDEAGGEICQFQDWVGPAQAEVALHGDEHRVVALSRQVLAQRDQGAIHPGDKIVVNSSGDLALVALPAPRDPLARYLFLDRSPLARIDPEHDLGAPPSFIYELGDHVVDLLRDPELLARWGVRASKNYFCTGSPGTGKTYSILAAIYHAQCRIAELIGVAPAALPPRVFRISADRILSQWLGQSDKHIAMFIDEVKAVAAMPYVGPDGRTWHLPTYVIWEETEGLARARGSDHDGVYDRILTTFLGRWEELAALPCISFCTSNAAHLMDLALTRRVSGETIPFRRLSRRQPFAAVLRKIIAHTPIASDNGYSLEQCQQALLQEVTATLYSANGAPPRLEVTFAGTSQPAAYYTRDFLTPALLDRAVQRAKVICRGRERRGEPAALTPGLVLQQIEEQVEPLVTAANAQNIGHYVDLPEGTRHVVSVRPVRAGAREPRQLVARPSIPHPAAPV